MVLMATLVIGSTAFVSCSSDDEDGSNGGMETSKRIKKITDKYDGGITTITFDYDAQGRVIKKLETENKWKCKTTYAYGDNTISSKNDEGETHTYTLSDGRITKDVVRDGGGYSDTYNYTYDSNGYLKSRSFSYSETKELTWADGNLTKTSTLLGNDDSYNWVISYSNISWPKNFMLDVEYLPIDNALEPLGVWGRMPKNLPSKAVHSGKDINIEYTYNYTIEGGVITKIVITDNGIAEGEPIAETETLTIEWE